MGFAPAKSLESLIRVERGGERGREGGEGELEKRRDREGKKEDILM